MLFMVLSDLALTNEIKNIIEEFLCHLFGYMKQINIQEVIKIHFENKNKPKYCLKPVSCIKGIEPTTFPPFDHILIQYLKRSWFIAKLYKMSPQPSPLKRLTALDYGWTLSNNFLTVKWFDGKQMSNVIDKIEYIDDSNTEDGEIDDSDEESESDSNIQLILLIYRLC